FQAEDGIRDPLVTGVQTCALPISAGDRRLLQDAYRLLYRSGLSPQRAVERIRQELPAAGPVTALLDFLAGARRGICGAAQRGSKIGRASCRERGQMWADGWSRGRR